MDTETLLAEAAVLRTANRYASAVDRIDLDLLRSCFFRDAQATYMGRVLPVGVEHIVEVIEGLRKISGTIHNLGPVATEITGDKATVHAGCLVLAVSDEAADLGVIRGVRYRFEMRLDHDDWRISSLHHEVLWASAAPRSDPMGRPLAKASQT
jgi:hypothetical protein